MHENTLQLRKLTISHKDRVIVELDTHIAKGEILTLMGPSGSGKSTALYAISGALASAFKLTGDIFLFGQNITLTPPYLRHVGILFQDDVLFPHLSVGGNLAFAIPSHIKGKPNRQKLICEALETAGLSGFAKRDPATLSGGQRARVALMRVLLSRPKALLLDEPFSKLDTDLRDQIRNFVFERARAENLPMILVTHDKEDALSAGGRILSPLGKVL